MWKLGFILTDSHGVFFDNPYESLEKVWTTTRCLFKNPGIAPPDQAACGPSLFPPPIKAMNSCRGKGHCWVSRGYTRLVGAAAAMLLQSLSFLIFAREESPWTVTRLPLRVWCLCITDQLSSLPWKGRYKKKTHQVRSIAWKQNTKWHIRKNKTRMAVSFIYTTFKFYFSLLLFGKTRKLTWTPGGAGMSAYWQ